jgi:hypothetical protein
MCGYFERLGEPPYPVTMPDRTRLSLRFTRSVGERAPSITLRFEVIDEDHTLLKAYETAPSEIMFEGKTWLSSRDTSRLLSSVAKYGFWSIPEKVPYPKVAKDSRGVESVVVCQAGLTIAGLEVGRHHVVDRLCPEANGEDKSLELWDAALHIAREHFPDLAGGPAWRNEVN